MAFLCHCLNMRSKYDGIDGVSSDTRQAHALIWRRRRKLFVSAVGQRWSSLVTPFTRKHSSGKKHNGDTFQFDVWSAY